jgi:hypothetical protein
LSSAADANAREKPSGSAAFQSTCRSRSASRVLAVSSESSWVSSRSIRSYSRWDRTSAAAAAPPSNRAARTRRSNGAGERGFIEGLPSTEV